MTGADSPVIADSSTEAMPFDDLAVAGDHARRRSTTHEVAELRAAERARLRRVRARPVRRRRRPARVGVGVRVLRSASACALPRPSATASAKLAKSTVNQSQTAMRRRTGRCAGARPPRRARRWRAAWSATAPISTMNITGLRPIVPRVELAQRAQGSADDGSA